MEQCQDSTYSIIKIMEKLHFIVLLMKLWNYVMKFKSMRKYANISKYIVCIITSYKLALYSLLFDWWFFVKFDCIKSRSSRVNGGLYISMHISSVRAKRPFADRNPLNFYDLSFRHGEPKSFLSGSVGIQKYWNSQCRIKTFHCGQLNYHERIKDRACNVS